MKNINTRRKLFLSLLIIYFSCNTVCLFAAPENNIANLYKGKISRINKTVDFNSDTKQEINSKIKKSNSKVILFVWDGLRPDVISSEYTPNLYKLKQQGSFFNDHHSSYPSGTMHNANSLATGNYVINRDTADTIDTIDNTPQSVMSVNTLLQTAKKYGLKTAQIGKAAPVTLQDADKTAKNSIILTSEMAYPFEFIKNLINKGYNIPKKIENLYVDQGLVIDKNKLLEMNKNSITELRTIDGSVPVIGLSNPEVALDSLAKADNDYFMDIFLKEILPVYQPDLSIIWLSEPDATAHVYGLGSKPYYKALGEQDAFLGKLLLYMDKLGLNKNTDLLVISDHGHSNVSADLEIFPLREIKDSTIGEVNKNGYSVSGLIRVADLLTKAGFKAFDGAGCHYNPVMQGMLGDRKLLSPIYADMTGKECKEGVGTLYTTPSYIIPKVLPEDALVVSANGGSTAIYLPKKNIELVQNVVRFLQSRLEFDVIFVDEKYGDLPGTLPFTKINIVSTGSTGSSNRPDRPDILVSMSYNEQQMINGVLGISYSNSNDSSRSSHGSLSPVEMKSVFIAQGPDFKSNYTDILPTANVDVPVTVSYLLNLPFDNRSGRIIFEAIKGSGVKASDYELKYSKIQPNKPAIDLKLQSLISQNGKEIVTDKDSYTFVLNMKHLYYKDQNYSYLDSGKAIRY